MHRHLLTTLVLCVGFASAQNSTLTGFVVTTTGLPVAGAAIHLDAGAFSATTSATGQFTITGLTNRSYVLQVDPVVPTLAPREQSVAINNATSLGNYVLQPGALITGVVVDPQGVPLQSANMNAYLPDGTKLYTPRDATDAAGNFGIVVPLTPVTVEALPPVGAPLFGARVDIAPTSAQSVGTLALAQAFTLTGSVVRSGATPIPIANCRVLVTDQFTDLELPLTGNTTNSLGAFSVMVPFGLYRLDFVPPTANLHVPKQYFGVAVVQPNTAIGLVGLDQAVALSGTVVGPTGVIANADVDVFDALGHKLFTPSDNTNATGGFSVRVPVGGNYSVRVDPLPTLGLTGLKVSVGAVNVATNIGTLTLQPGIPITLDLFDVRGRPLADVNMRLRDPTTGFEVIVPGNTTDVQGRMVAIVPPGVFDVTLRAPQGGLTASVSVPGVPFVAPFSVPLVLPDKFLRTNLTSYPTLGIANGGDLPVAWTIENPTIQLQSVTIEGFVLLESGVEVPWIPQIPLDVPGPLNLTLSFLLPMPPLAAPELRWEQRFQVRIRDAATQAVLDEAYVRFFPF